MEKKILVTIGYNNRIVAFTTPDPSIALDSTPVHDATVLARAIRESFKDVMTNDQKFFLQIKNQEWGDMYVDLVGTEQVADRFVCRAVLKPVVLKCSLTLCKKLLLLLINTIQV